MTRPIEGQPCQFLTFGPETLTLGHCHYLAAGLASLIRNWSIELHYDEHSDATIVIMPNDLDDAIFPTLIVRSDESAFHLEELFGEVYRELGEYRMWSDVLRAARIRLIWAGPSQTTLH
jgi:hypothetical protein